METGPTYSLLNVTLCPAKYQTTNDLEKLNQVELFYFVLIKKTINIMWSDCFFQTLSQNLILIVMCSNQKHFLNLLSTISALYDLFKQKYFPVHRISYTLYTQILGRDLDNDRVFQLGS